MQLELATRLCQQHVTLKVFQAMASGLVFPCNYGLQLDTRNRVVTSDEHESEHEFVQLFKEALQVAETSQAMHDDNPIGDEFGDCLLPGYIVERYNTICTQKLDGIDGYWDQCTYLLRAVPGSLKRACMETAIGAETLRVVQIFLTMVDELLEENDSDEEQEEETGDATSTDVPSSPEELSTSEQEQEQEEQEQGEQKKKPDENAEEKLSENAEEKS